MSGVRCGRKALAGGRTWKTRRSGESRSWPDPWNVCLRAKARGV